MSGFPVNTPSRADIHSAAAAGLCVRGGRAAHAQRCPPDGHQPGRQVCLRILEPCRGGVLWGGFLLNHVLRCSLALVTCREPLRVSLSAQLRSLLAPSLERETLDNAVGVLTGDNLELGCSVIEKTAADKAIREIDERLMPAYQVRVGLFQRELRIWLARLAGLW